MSQFKKWCCPACGNTEKPYDRSLTLSPRSIGFCCKNGDCRYVGHKIEFLMGKLYKDIRIKSDVYIKVIS